MKYWCKYYLFVFIVYLYIEEVKVDLPVHCLSSKIEGNWIVYMGDNSHDKDLKCGHKRPDQNLDHYNTDVDRVFKHKFEVIVKLERPDKVLSIKDNKQLGKWTMIYDEGFEFTILDQVFFAFNRYKKTGRFSASNTDTEDTKGYMNICNKTFLGWYHNKNSNLNWGCYWTEKIEEKKLKSLDISLISYRNIFKLNVIPDLSRKAPDNFFSNNENNSSYERDVKDKDDFSSLKNNFLKNSKIKKEEIIQKANKENKHNHINNNLEESETNKINNNDDVSNTSTNSSPNNNTKEKIYSYVDFLKSLRIENSKSKYNNIPHLDIYFMNDEADNGKNSNGNFLEVNSSTKLFQPDYDYVNKINDPKNKYLWTAKVHDDFVGKSYTQMRTLLGNTNFHKTSFFDDLLNHNGHNNNQNNDKMNNNNNNFDNNNNNDNFINQKNDESKEMSNHMKEKERLISSSKNDIKNFLEYGMFLEFDINVNTSSSFISTEMEDESYNRDKNRFKNKNSELNGIKTGASNKFRSSSFSKNSKMELENELESESEFANNSSKNYNKKYKNNSSNNLDNDSNSYNDNDIEITEFNSNTELKQDDKYGKLPLDFDWRNVDGTNYDSPVRKQGECGSCYAIAATSVMESRIRIKSNNRLKPLLSPSSIISCSRYNQGCYGGYPYLVGKFAKEFGFVEEVCQPYTETDDKCFDFCFHEKRWKVKNYG